MKKVLSADVLSPILAYMRLDAPHKMILESIPREKENARFSIVAYRPVSEVKFENGVLYFNDQIVEEDPLDFLNRITVKTKTSEELPFNGGAIGFVGYDLIGLYENIGSIPEDTIGTPDLHFFLYESYVIFDHKKEKVYVVEENLYSGRSEAEQASSLEQVLAQLARPAKEEFQDKDLHALHFHNHLEQKEFEEMVALARDYIRKGDMFQCALSQRFSADFSGKPLDYYRNLRVTNPSNYLYFYDFGEYQIIGASPESLVSVKDRVVTTNPIAGTRPRGIDEEADRMLADAPTDGTDYEKALYVFEKLITEVDYVDDSADNQNIISVFLNHETICQGYAYATQYLLEKLGISCTTVLGNVSDGPHAWNLVKLDGDYYYIDTTWGNSQYLSRQGEQKEAVISKYIDYNYFGISTADIMQSHTADERISLPGCTATADNYYVHEGRYITEWNPETIGAIFAQAYQNGENMVQVKFASTDLYEQAMQYFVEEYGIAKFCPGLNSFRYMEDIDGCVLFIVF